jgi:predicted nucleic acid-binding protein
MPWEVGNALSALIKRGRLTKGQALEAERLYAKMPIRQIAVPVADALYLAADENLYAYDAYMLACAKRADSPLLTLDERLRAVAQALDIRVVEV